LVSDDRRTLIDGLWYLIFGNKAVRDLQPGERPSRNADVVVPHPDAGKRQRGWRREIIYLAILLVLAACCLIYALPQLAAAGM
jgi:hypothetical protein